MILKVFPLLPEAFSGSSEPGWRAILPSRQLARSALKGSGPGSEKTQGPVIHQFHCAGAAGGFRMQSQLSKPTSRAKTKVNSSQRSWLGNVMLSEDSVLGLLYRFPVHFPPLFGMAQETNNYPNNPAGISGVPSKINHSLKWLSYTKMPFDRDELFCCFKRKIAFLLNGNNWGGCWRKAVILNIGLQKKDLLRLPWQSKAKTAI